MNTKNMQMMAVSLIMIVGAVSGASATNDTVEEIKGLIESVEVSGTATGTCTFTSASADATGDPEVISAYASTVVESSREDGQYGGHVWSKSSGNGGSEAYAYSSEFVQFRCSSTLPDPLDITDP